MLRAGSPIPDRTGVPGFGWRPILLALVLPMFAGTFSYVIDVPALYALAKVWPLLMLPFAALATIRLAPDFQPPIFIALVWLLGFVPLIGVVVLGNDIVGATAAGAKIWPLTGALGAAGLLWLIKPSLGDLARVVTVLAIVTFGFLIGAWWLAPDAWFNAGIEETKVFLSDPERGRRINAPMMFAILGLFLLNRSFWARPKAWKAALILLGLAAMILFYKQRAQIAGTLCILAMAGLLSLRRWRTPAILVATGCFVALAIPVGLWVAERAADSLGGSLSMRQIEAEAALRFLNDNPWRWITGVGSATRVGGVTLGDIVGTPFFFPSDLGWLGVVFEYGLIGAGLMLALHILAIRMAWQAACGAGLLAMGVLDYAIFLLIVSPVVSVVLAPGELATVMALSWWLIRTPRAPQGAGSQCAP